MLLQTLPIDKILRYPPSPVPGPPLHPLSSSTISNPSFLQLIDAACCLSPTTSGASDKVYVTDGQLGGTGITYYSMSPPPAALVGQCCNDQAPYSIDVIPGTGLAGRFIFSETISSTVRSYSSDGGFAAEVGSSRVC